MIIETEQYRRWSKNDYVRMAETGILADGERTELFEGVILTFALRIHLTRIPCRVLL